MKKFDSIIFDVDGTLWDATGTLAKAYSAASEEFYECFGLAPKSFTKEQIMGELGQPTIEIFHHLYPVLDGLCPNDFLRCFRHSLSGDGMLAEHMSERKEPSGFAGMKCLDAARYSSDEADGGPQTGDQESSAAEEDIETIYEYMVWRSMEYEYDFLRREGAEVYPLVQETLNTLKKRYRLFIVSNCEKGYIELFTGFSGTGKLFEGWLSYGDTGVEKDRTIHIIMERFGLKKPVYVGDILKDALSSRRAGVGFIWASYGFGEVPEDLRDARIGSFAELADRLS